MGWVDVFPTRLQAFGIIFSSYLFDWLQRFGNHFRMSRIEDPSVLYLQESHISSVVSPQTIDEIIRVKRSDNLIWKLYLENGFHSRVKAYLHHMGFLGVLQCGFRVYDNHLITALVERWRRETYTFHFRCGEATITLQDVSIIWGLSIDGEHVSGVDDSHKVGEWQHICLNLLGFTPLASYFKGGHFSMTALYEHCISIHIEDNSSEVDVVKYSRCVALMIIGGIMLPDYKGGSARLIFLQLLRNIDRIKSYNWGGAVLAFLYRELCNATRIGKSIISGPLLILQIWAWSRIKCVNPDRTGLSLLVASNSDAEIMPFSPYGARYTHAPTHSFRIIRDCFDRMNHDEFNWIVYERNDPDVRTIIDSYDTNIWRCVCHVICFEIIEMHRSNRVLRQFEMRQPIPQPAVDNDGLHNITKIGHRNTNWREYHENAIIFWNRRMRHVVQGELHGRSRQTNDDYFPWYERITVRIISPTVSEIGFRPYPHNVFAAGHHDIPQHFSTPANDKHQTSSGYVPRPSGWHAHAGPSTLMIFRQWRNPSIEGLNAQKT
ncbi:serine/threonine-protein phosphatase 7 long form homolog [Henckelia pumila]|uniref:serine/threonine-protein phosphatase 7 long form homolog n=1 Tax=Henckelia pumila TaxID=405737 RepID=UPI003C6E8BE8